MVATGSLIVWSLEAHRTISMPCLGELAAGRTANDFPWSTNRITSSEVKQTMIRKRVKLLNLHKVLTRCLQLLSLSSSHIVFRLVRDVHNTASPGSVHPGTRH
jgi:hypothetical protein